MVAVLFSDIKGYSKLDPSQTIVFVTEVLRLLGERIEKYRPNMIEINTWGDAIFATSTDIVEMAHLALDIRDFFDDPPREHADFIKKFLRIRIALDFVEVEVGSNFLVRSDPVTSRPPDGCHGKELARAARLEPVTAPNHVFVTETFAKNLEQRAHADVFKLVRFPHRLHLPKGYGAMPVFSLHRFREGGIVEYKEEDILQARQAIAPVMVDSWLIPEATRTLRHEGVRRRLAMCKDGELVCFLCITGKSVIFPELRGGETLTKVSLIAGAMTRGVKFRGIVLDPDCTEARFRSQIESPGETNPAKRLLQRDAERVRGVVSHDVWEKLKQRIPGQLVLKKTQLGLSFNLWLFTDQAIIEPYHFGKLFTRKDEAHMCKFSQFAVWKVPYAIDHDKEGKSEYEERLADLEERLNEEYSMLRHHFEDLWAKSEYLWPEIHGPRSAMVQSLLKPANLQEQLKRTIEAPPPTLSRIRVEHLVSNTLRIGPRLQQAFEEIGRRLKIGVHLHEAKKGQNLDEFVRRAKTGPADFILLQLHGIEGEEQLLEPLLKAKKDEKAGLAGRLIVYIHRPEEAILRIASENEDCPYWVAKELMAKNLSQAAAVVLSGNCFVSEYQEMLPEVPVVFIPLGFAEADAEVDVDVSSRLDDSAVAFIGSDTTWGEMRHIKDLLHLMQAIRFIDGNLKATGYALGNFDHNCDLDKYRSHPDVVFVSNQEIETAYSQGAFPTELEFREWLHHQAPGKLIIRARAEHDKVVPERIPQTMQPLFDWENRIIDFNVQLYRENLNRNRDPERQGQPKVEYSGTLHKGAAHVLFVVFESPAMDDVERDEGLYMIRVPMSKGRRSQNCVAAGISPRHAQGFAPTNTGGHEGSQELQGQPHFYEGAAGIVRLIRNPEERREKLARNQVACKAIGMREIAFAFWTLMRQLD